MWKAIAGASVQGIMNMANSALDRYQNFYYGEKSADNALRRQSQMIEQYSTPLAQLRLMKQAGLSPSIMMSNGIGSIGTTGAMGTGANGPTTQGVTIDPLTRAQIDNIDADTENIKEDTNTKRGNNALGQATIANIVADTKNKTAQTAAAQADTYYQMIINEITDENKEGLSEAMGWQSKACEYQLGIVIEELAQAKNTTELMDKTKKDQIEQMQIKTMQDLENYILTSKKVELTEAQRQKIVNDIKNDNARLELEISKFEWEKIANRRDFEQRLTEFMSEQSTIAQHNLQWMIDNENENNRQFIENIMSILNIGSRFKLMDRMLQDKQEDRAARMYDNAENRKSRERVKRTKKQ